MTCEAVRPRLLDYQRGQLDPDAHAAVRTHLEGCTACAREEAAEQALTEALEERLPQHSAPLGLKRRLAVQWPAPPAAQPSWWTRWGRTLVPACAAAAVLLAVLPLYFPRAGVSQAPGPGIVAEAVNDHLRLITSQHPLDIESGTMHQVKPWFEGRLDFAPVVAFLGDQDFPLQGGAVGYFLDRKAAVFVFHRRLHAISLLVFRAAGLPWPTRGLERIGNADAYTTLARGFNVILWRHGELGYALTSDLDRHELTQLAAKLAAGD
jgi:anti-sigma factor RsiW